MTQVQEKVLKVMFTLATGHTTEPVTAERVARRARLKPAAARRHLVALVQQGRLTRRFDYETKICHGKRQPVGRYVYTLAKAVP